MQIGDLITAYINEHGISLREFARRACMSSAGISYYINGKMQNGVRLSPPIPDTLTISKIARAMNLTPTELLSCLSDDLPLPAAAKEKQPTDFGELSPIKRELIELVLNMPDEKAERFLLFLQS